MRAYLSSERALPTLVLTPEFRSCADTPASPASRCFCRTGYFGPTCASQSRLTASWEPGESDHALDDGDFTLRWHVNETHIEVARTP